MCKLNTPYSFTWTDEHLVIHLAIKTPVGLCEPMLMRVSWPDVWGLAADMVNEAGKHEDAVDGGMP